MTDRLPDNEWFDDVAAEPSERAPSRVKSRIRLSTKASASPTAIMAVVLVLGANPSGQTSSSGP